MSSKRLLVGLALLLAGALAAVTLSAIVTPEAEAAGPDGWFESFEGVSVAPVSRDDVSQLYDAGTIETDGFSDLVFSLGGEFKEALPSSGTIGAILIPDEELFDYLLRNEGIFVFPLEVTFDVSGLGTSVFISPQQRAKIAFPSYRVYLYNETTSGASVSLYVYRSR